MKRPLLAIPVGCATAFLAVACSGSTQPSSAPLPTTTTTTFSIPTTSKAPVVGPLATVNPCSLLTPAQLPQHKLGQGVNHTPADGVRTCDWQRLDTSSGQVDDSAYLLSAAIYDDTSLRNLNETDNTMSAYQSFGQHQARNGHSDGVVDKCFY